jgi:hypothetical protein
MSWHQLIEEYRLHWQRHLNPEVLMSISPRSVVRTSLAFLPALLFANLIDAHAQAIIKVSEDVNFRVGVLGQFQGDWIEDPAADDTTQNLFIRRVRLLFGGQVAKNVSFFVETDAPNLGRTLPGGKNISPSLIVQDAYGEFKAHNAFALDAGLMFVPFSRNSIQSAATLLAIDYGAFTFAQSGPTQSTIGRDAGFQAKGYFLANRLEYRLGAFQGARDTASHRSFRYAGRVQVQLLEPEVPGFFYTGTYLGRRKVVAVGAAFDTQSDYQAYDGDVFVDVPVGPGAVTAQLAYNRFDGGDTFLTLPEQDVFFAEAGYLIRNLKLTPVVQFTRRDVTSTPLGDETRWSVGLNYWWAAHNANIKAAYNRIDPRGPVEQNGFTIQLQVFFY